MKRSGPLRRNTPLRRTGRLNPMSDKRRKALGERKEVREEVLDRDGYTCTAKDILPDIDCWGPLDVDEIIGRGRGGDWLDPENCQTLCRAHHMWKHDNPEKALELGLSKRLGPRNENTYDGSATDSVIAPSSDTDGNATENG